MKKIGVVVNNVLKTAGDANFLTRRLMRLAGMLLWFLILFVGCAIPVSRTTVIPKGVAQNTEELIAKLDLLKTGMEVGEVFELLEIKRTTPGVREFVTAEEKQRLLYGATQLIGSPQELEQFRSHLSKHGLRFLKLSFLAI